MFTGAVKSCRGVQMLRFCPLLAGSQVLLNLTLRRQG